MPFVRIDTLRAGPERLAALGRAVHDALMETIAIPPDDRFQVLTDHDGTSGTLRHDDYLGVHRDDDIAYVAITLRSGRTPAQKQALYRRIAELAHAYAGTEPRNVFVVLTENESADWSLGEGVAQYLGPRTAARGATSPRAAGVPSMEITGQPRTPEQRRADLLGRLEGESDIWVATADAEGVPCLVPLWFVWHDEAVWLCTRLTNPTGQNLRDGGRARLAFGDTRDVALVDGEVRTYPLREVPSAAAEAFHEKTGWDPREDHASYAFFRVRPRAVQAWCEAHELPRRHLVREGVWAV